LCKRHLDFQAPFALTHVWPIRSFRVNSSFKPICSPAQSRVAYAKSETQTRKGFTLVELIVVIVILGILAAIAIPALTGYISKAEDKQWEMQARDINIAVKTVIDEAWARGDFAGNDAALYFAQGDDDFSSLKHSQIMNLDLSSYAYSDGFKLYREAARLIGEEYAVPTTGDDPFWMIDYIAPLGSDATAATADAFYLAFCPEGIYDAGKPLIGVSYKLTRFDEVATANDYGAAIESGDIAYDANAGYEVYHLVL
jgi:prepilin-type N-terminal cleavage/methylation domain-containing protein